MSGLSTDLGWINCDKFYENDAEKVDFFVELPKDSPAHVMLVFKDINSVISYSQRLKNRYVFNNIPDGLDVEIIAFVIDDDLVNFGRKSSTTSKKSISINSLKAVNKERLPELLNDL